MTIFSLILDKLSPLARKEIFSAAAALGISLIYLYKAKRVNKMPEIKLSDFIRALEQNIIVEIVLQGGIILFRPVNSDLWYQTYAPILNGKNIIAMIKDNPAIQFSCSRIIQKLDPIQAAQLGLLGMSICYCLFQIAQMNGFFVKNHQVKKRQGAQDNFSAIHGLVDAKKQLKQIIDFINQPARYKQIGARLRRGVIIYGPPGTGKTLLARATANECGVFFISISACEFVEMYVGLGAKRVRQIFTHARQNSPAIIFIDEIDSVAFKRKNQILDNNQSSENERENTLNQLLVELDGFSENENIVVIVATNRIGVIDEALMRSGRFDIKIEVQLPSQDERFGILKLHLDKKKHICTVELIKQIAQNSKGFSGADMETIANESAYVAIDANSEIIKDEDVLNAFLKIFETKKKLIDHNQYPRNIYV